MTSILEKKISSKKALIGIIGLGYIGLSLADVFAKSGFKIVGFDSNPKKVEDLKKKKKILNFFDFSLLFSLLDNKHLILSSDSSVLKNADIIIISVSTSLDEHRVPDLTNLRSAFKTVNKHAKKNQLIILQSSTYPGTTEEEVLPMLNTKHKIGKDIFLAHVPEVADIGNPDFNFTRVPRIISGITSDCAKLASQLYAEIGCKIYVCSSPKVAEAAKLLQNAYRLLNISFINEMKIMFDKMGIDVWEVIEAAATKPFGFVPFYPGPGIGGDCIPIAPLYLVWKAKVSEGPTTLLELAAHVNESIPTYVYNKVILGLSSQKKTSPKAKILLLGVGYKKDVNDVRESPALKILALLKKTFTNVHYNDPYVDKIQLPTHEEMKSVDLDYKKLKKYDAVIINTDHSCYDWKEIAANSSLIIDTRNVLATIKHSKKKVFKA